MEKIALITDSLSDVSSIDIEKYNVKLLPLRVIYSNREYIDGVTITSEQLYKNIDEEIPSTSLPPMEDMEDLYKQLEEEHYTHAIAITVSSRISGTYNALTAISNNYSSIKSCIFDSRSISLGEGALVLDCGEMIQNHKSFKEIVELLPSIRNKTFVFYVLDTLKYLIKGGRIGKISGTIGEKMNIKPIISVNDKGEYYSFKKARGKKKAINILLKILQSNLTNNKLKVWVMHGGAENQAKNLYDDIAKLSNIKELNFGEISPAAGVHTGPGLIGLAFERGD